LNFQIIQAVELYYSYPTRTKNAFQEANPNIVLKCQSYKFRLKIIKQLAWVKESV